MTVLDSLAGYNLKRLSLICLTVQNVALILVMRYSRTRSVDMYLASSVIFTSEIVKVLINIFLLFCEEKTLRGTLRQIYQQILCDPWDCILMSMTALAYVFQNNLFILAVSHLDAATFQVANQLKLLTTAIFFRFLLKRHLTFQQWTALVMLFIGVSFAQLGAVQTQNNNNAAAAPLSPVSLATAGNSAGAGSGSGSGAGAGAGAGAGTVGLAMDNNKLTEQNPWIGMLAVIIASCLSGFAGVYFEKLLKNSSKSLWIRNIQLSGLSVPFALMTVYVQDKDKVYENGFFYGYDWIVGLVIFLQSFGGLVVSVVMKYADNVLKGFATSASIILSTIISIYWLAFMPTIYFIFGAFLVTMAIFIYAMYPPKSSTFSSISSSTAPPLLPLTNGNNNNNSK